MYQEENKLIQVAMQIILYAGNARNNLNDSLEYAKKFEFDKAEELFQSANANIVSAHKAQTNIIQSEADGNKYEHSLLFAHAQDTLMTIMSEMTISRNLIDILKIIEDRTKNGGNNGQ